MYRSIPAGWCWPPPGLTLGGTLLGNPAPGGSGSQVDISSQFIEITGSSDEALDTGYLGIDAAALSSLGADSLLIGGTRSMTTDGTVITPTVQRGDCRQRRS